MISGSRRHDGVRREGVERLSEGKKAESRRPSADQVPDKTIAKKRKPAGENPADVGRALKSVYDETVREEVPADFLDLLGKLN